MRRHRPQMAGFMREDRRPRGGSPHKKSGHLTVAAGPARPAKPRPAPSPPLRLRARGGRGFKDGCRSSTTAEESTQSTVERRSKTDSYARPPIHRHVQWHAPLPRISVFLFSPPPLSLPFPSFVFTPGLASVWAELPSPRENQRQWQAGHGVEQTRCKDRSTTPSVCPREPATLLRLELK